MVKQIKTRDVLSENIRQLREESGKTKTELCNAIGMSRSYWDALEAGEKDASTETLDRLAGLFGVTVEELVEPKRKKAS